MSVHENLRAMIEAAGGIFPSEFYERGFKEGFENIPTLDCFINGSALDRIDVNSLNPAYNEMATEQAVFHGLMDIAEKARNLAFDSVKVIQFLKTNNRF
jgi:hypothetical protein